MLVLWICPKEAIKGFPEGKIYGCIEKKHGIYRGQYYLWFQASNERVLGRILVDKRGTTVQTLVGHGTNKKIGV